MLIINELSEKIAVKTPLHRPPRMVEVSRAYWRNVDKHALKAFAYFAPKECKIIKFQGLVQKIFVIFKK
jgi:hypothetical protein